jgi:hypothetical protein
LSGIGPAIAGLSAALWTPAGTAAARAGEGPPPASPSTSLLLPAGQAVRRASAEPVGEPAPAELSTVLPPRADAGDDQVGLTDRPVTLDGSRSRPAGALGYRWIQVGGPPAVPTAQDGAYLAFTPRQPGVYRFLLVVASGSRISEPDAVEVTVGTPPAAASPLTSAPDGPAVPTEELARAALADVPGGPEMAEAIAGHLDAVAGRVELYGAYADVLAELSRRLDGCLPADPPARSAWDQKFSRVAKSP